MRLRFMANLRQISRFQLAGDPVRLELQKHRSELLQHCELTIVDIRPFVLFESEDEEPPTSKIGANKTRAPPLLPRP